MADVPRDADDQADSATMGAPRHGAAVPRGQDGVPLSTLHEGRFGRMFRDPQPLRPDDATITRRHHQWIVVHDFGRPTGPRLGSWR